MASWMIPGALGDIPVALDFDEATGRCVAAMASGRVWVKETTNFLSEPRVFPLVKLLPDFVCSLLNTFIPDVSVRFGLTSAFSLRK